MRVGHGTAALPVPAGTPLGGYADRHGGSSGVLDELQVDCVCLGGARGRLVLIVAEVVCINGDLATEVRDRVRRALGAMGEPVVDVWVCATHTHSGPDVRCVAGGAATPQVWRRRIGDAALEATLAAIASEHDCAGRLHSGELRDIGSQRGRAEAAHRVSVDVLSCADTAGIVKGVLAVVPVHPTVLPAASTVVSGDLAGAIRASLRDELGAPWVVVATGAAGDISTRHTRRAQTSEECRRLGRDAARQIATLMRAPPTGVWELGRGECAAARRTLAVPVRRQDPVELDAVRRRLETEHAGDAQRASAGTARTVQTALQGVEAALALHRREGASAVGLSLSAARIGRLCVFGIGAEAFHAVGERLRARCPDPAITLGYTNGHVGYLPDEAAYDTTGYEVLSSPLPRETAAISVDALVELLPNPTED